MLSEMIRSVIGKTMQTDYPHILIPLAVKARVTKVWGGAAIYQYNLQILNPTGADDEQYPEIPGVKSDVALERGETAAVLLMYGQLDPYIVGKAVS